MSVTWSNELISWNPEDFCGITEVSLPREMLWNPDLSIYELTEKENGPPSPYLYITHDGEVNMEENLRLHTICTMDVHKFPFDIQSCHITILSIIHSNSEMKLIAASNSSEVMQNSRQFLLSQGEWELLGLTVAKENVTYFDGPCWISKYT
uniref:Si:dkey-49c17.4 n=1 Tax=Pygocentrus nattereri TaxID=42514 RepID=A0A3B4DPE0_PYGNA